MNKEDLCGGKLIEATFPDGDVLRFWFQQVHKIMP